MALIELICQFSNYTDEFVWWLCSDRRPLVPIGLPQCPHRYPVDSSVSLGLVDRSEPRISPGNESMHNSALPARVYTVCVRDITHASVRAGLAMRTWDICVARGRDSTSSIGALTRRVHTRGEIVLIVRLPSRGDGTQRKFDKERDGCTISLNQSRAADRWCELAADKSHARCETMCEGLFIS